MGKGKGHGSKPLLPVLNPTSAAASGSTTTTSSSVQIPSTTATSSAHAPVVAVVTRAPPSTASDESEESYLDSLEEGRAPLLGDLDGEDISRDDEPGGRETEDERIEPIGDYSTTDQSAVKNARRRIPRERLKGLVALLMLFIATLSNDIVLSFVHDRIPSGPPLPDFVFDNTPYWPWALSVSEYFMLTSFATLMLLTFLHRHRWVMLRRIAVIGALLYGGRCLTMFVTQVPVADPNYYCSPKFTPDERTFWNVLVRGLRLLSGFGLNLRGKHVLCGDYIYSGHTIVHVTCYLFIREYSPRNWFLLHYTSMTFSTIGVLCLLVSRGHYSIDVIVAYWIATRVFWQYHTLADISLLRTGQQGRNHLTKVFWFPLFRFMEGNVFRPVPKRYGLPAPLKLLLPNRQRAGSTGRGSGDRIH